MIGQFYLEYMGQERVPAAGGDVLALRLDGTLKTADPDPMTEFSDKLIPGHVYNVTIEEV